MPLSLPAHCATNRVPTLLGQRTAQPPHRLPNRATRGGQMDGSPGPASPRPEPPPGRSGTVMFWVAVSLIICSVGAICVAYCDDDHSLAAGVIVTITGLALMGTALWEGIVLSERDRQNQRGDR